MKAGRNDNDMTQQNGNLASFKEAEIITLDFDESGIARLQDMPGGTDWPVVYILNNETTAYVGQTDDACSRMKNHKADLKKSELTRMNIILDSHFNKSVILDLEGRIIKMMAADDLFTLLNANSGQKSTRNYYQKQIYDNVTFPHIWDLLQETGLARDSYNKILNSDLFKFSPYTTLSQEQFDTAKNILISLIDSMWTGNNTSGLQGITIPEPVLDPSLDSSMDGRTFFINGDPGTGKTVLAVYLFKWIYDLQNSRKDGWKKECHGLDKRKLDFFCAQHFKIGFVVPQPSLRDTLKKVFKQAGIPSGIVLNPSDAARGKFDILVIDEGHRLRRRNGLANYKQYDDTCKELGLDPKEATELDWLLASSTWQILVYDEKQCVKASDALRQTFYGLKLKTRSETFRLNSQMRVAGGEDYIRYIKSIFSDNPPDEKLDFSSGYDMYLYDDFRKLKEDLAVCNKKYGLCRLAAGYGFEWKTKKFAKNLYSIPEDSRPYDFMLDGVKLTWNTTKDDWINSEHASQEVGCIYTVQGYDLNYAGIIIGPELTYDKAHERIVFDKSKYSDTKNKQSASREDLKQLVLDAYQVMLTRGIRGTFIYAVDKNMRDYLSRFIPVKGQE